MAICSTSIPWANSSTICVRRHVTTEPELRRTIRSSRLPSSLESSRTRNRSLATSPLDLDHMVGISLSDRDRQVVDLRGEGSLMRH
ncbi:MAG TPA: hypothetical protein VK988_20775 [Acidimicrobiales bacterium]|nr:hypothetical protein [Acidimicrobiales bacterium]